LGCTGATPGSGQTFGARKGAAFGIRVEPNCSARLVDPQLFARVRNAPASSALKKRRLVNPVTIAKTYTKEHAV
jgi:hypothetical protein